MTEYNFTAPDANKVIKDNRLVWEGKIKESGQMYRLVLVYLPNNNPTKVVLEKSTDNSKSAMGEQRWEQVDISAIPEIYWRDVIKAISGDEDIFDPVFKPSSANKKTII